MKLLTTASTQTAKKRGWLCGALAFPSKRINLMLIKQGYFVKNLFLGSRKSPITYTYGGPHSIRVSLKKTSSKNLPKANNIDVSICTATGSYTPSEKVKQYFINIDNNTLPSEMADNEEVLEYLAKTAKTVERIHIKYFPQPFKDFMRNVRNELHDVIKHTVGIYMWRCGLTEVHDPLYNGGMAFSLDGQKWNIIPPGVKASFRVTTIPSPPKYVSLSIKKLIKSENEQPVGHQLFREAQYLRTTNPRVSILVAVSALEVAVKECISKLVPDSNWLVENLPSPDVRQLINQYLPKLLIETPLENIQEYVNENETHDPRN